MRIIEWVALLLVIFGALNWGVIGLTGVDVFSGFLGEGSVTYKFFYGLIGVASFYLLLLSISKFRNCTFGLIRKPSDNHDAHSQEQMGTFKK